MIPISQFFFYMRECYVFQDLKSASYCIVNAAGASESSQSKWEMGTWDSPDLLPLPQPFSSFVSVNELHLPSQQLGKHSKTSSSALLSILTTLPCQIYCYTHSHFLSLGQHGLSSLIINFLTNLSSYLLLLPLHYPCPFSSTSSYQTHKELISVKMHLKQVSLFLQNQLFHIMQ